MADELRILLTFLTLGITSGKLVINVSKGREQASVITQSVTGNSSADLVQIEFLTPCGDSVTQVTDFRSKATVTVHIVPGELDLGQTDYQVFCFVSASVGDMIPPEAVTKLRQKHPGTVRVAEESRGQVVQDNPLEIDPKYSSVLSSQLGPLCKNGHIFSSENEVRKILQGRKSNAGLIIKNAVPYESTKRCSSVSIESEENCICSLSSCVRWYPCSLKYCKNQVGDGEHRCGIRTCSKCTTHRFLVNSPAHCVWDRES